MILTELLYIIYSKSAKITLSVCVAVGKFVCDVNGGKPAQAVYGLSQECKVEIWLDSYISCYICFTKLNFSLIIELDVLPCHIALS